MIASENYFEFRHEFAKEVSALPVPLQSDATRKGRDQRGRRNHACNRAIRAVHPVPSDTDGEATAPWSITHKGAADTKEAQAKDTTDAKDARDARAEDARATEFTEDC